MGSPAGNATSRRMRQTPLAWTSMAAVAALLIVGSARTVTAEDARILDSGGRTLTVGNWLVPFPGQDGHQVPDPRRLGWHLRDGNTLILSGTVPQTFDWYVESSPVLSRNPVTGEILLAWSRQNHAGMRDVVTMPFVDNSWLPARMVVAARGALSTQVDPCLIHDASGNAFLAWRDLDWQRRVLMLVLDVDGRVLLQQVLSDGVDEPGPPTLGLDQRGDVVAAFFGKDSADGSRRVFVSAKPSDDGGLIHVPNPIVELAVTTSRPTTAVTGSATTLGAATPELHVGVLSGTTVVWWTRNEPDGTPVLEHLAQTFDGGWEDGRLGRIVLTEEADPIQEALELLRVRFMRPTSSQATSPDADASRSGLSDRR